MTSDWHQKNNNGVGTDFKYFVNGNEINKTGPIDLKKGERCLIMFDSIRPRNCLMLGHHNVPDYIEAPSNAWRFNEIPVPIDSAQLKEYFDKLDID